MKASELKRRYLEFFKSKKHAIIKSFPLIPEHDPTVLFTTAGMHPLVPHLLGEAHPEGRRLADVQKCIRTGDIEDVGDDVHLTFFEMLGNWSLGDYFKKEAIEWSFEFLTSKKWLNLDVNKLGITCFKGDKDAAKDEEASNIWLSLGIKKERIAFLPKKDNFWGPAGEFGPCGPCTEMFYYTGDKTPKKFDPPDEKWVEIWNDVFMQYNKTKNGYEKLRQHNVDTGMGVERTASILQGKKSVYETEVFLPIIRKIEEITKKKYGSDKGETRVMRIISDHLKAAVFILGDERSTTPSNLGQGYVLRRLIRRSIRYGREIGIPKGLIKQIAEEVIRIYKDDYPELNLNKDIIIQGLNKEEDKFDSAIEKGLKKVKNLLDKKIPLDNKKFIKLMQLENKKDIFKKLFRNKKLKREYSIKELNLSKKEIDNATISGKEAFYLYQTYGFPMEILVELVRSKQLIIDIESFNEEFKKHQEISRIGAEKTFKGGLSEASDITAKLHTATHLLHAALRKVLGEKVQQKGSNITPERLRFDFSFERKMTDKEIKEVEDIVNKKIKEKLQVIKKITSPEEAKKEGALAFFGHKYGDKVSVYDIKGFSKEICMGPHTENTSELGNFKIKKEEAIAAGIRRIKAVLD